MLNRNNFRNYQNRTSQNRTAIPVLAQVSFDTIDNDLVVDNRIELIAKYSGDIFAISRDLGAEVEPLDKGYAIITVDQEKIPQLYTYTQIEHLELPKSIYYEVNQHLGTTCVSAVHEDPSTNLTGTGVVVAIIDSGIDYMHKDFQNEDGTSRIISIWDQTADGTPPQGFFDGAEYTNQQINTAIKSTAPHDIVPSIDSLGHGTAVAGIAAGNGRSSNGVNKGVAPEADILVVKVGSKGYKSFARSTELMRAIKYVIDKSKELSKPVVINISFGMNNGSHTGDSLFETYISDISMEWKIAIVIPTGNEGVAGHHYQGKLVSNEIKEVEFFSAGGISRFYISLWKNFTDALSVEVIFPNGMTSGIIGIDSLVKTVRQDNLVLTVIYGQPSHYTVSQEIYFNFYTTEGSFKPGVWKLRLIPEKIVDGQFNMWLPTVETVTERTFFSNPTEFNTMTIPSTAKKVIAVAGYNDTLNSSAEFSGKGALNQTLPNPDLAAPAVDITSTKVGGGYGVFTGTSFAAPFVTGSAALMMQWGIIDKNDAFLYGERIKAFLRLGANRNKNNLYPNPVYGYGTLCLKNTMEYLKKYKSGGVPLWQMR